MALIRRRDCSEVDLSSAASFLSRSLFLTESCIGTAVSVVHTHSIVRTRFASVFCPPSSFAPLQNRFAAVDAKNVGSGSEVGKAAMALYYPYL